MPLLVQKIVIVPLKDYVLSYQCLYLTICERLTISKTISEMYYGIFYHHNNIAVLERIYHIRHELFMNTHVFRLIQEVLQGLKEAWLENLTNTLCYKQTNVKLERGLQLVKEYQEELDTMIHLQEVVSSHRGNEIMKALTVLTAVSTPLTALGALWGMNFKYMPELEWKYSYLIALLFIIFTTGGMYMYMRFKGWTGDLLRVKKKKSFFKSN